MAITQNARQELNVNIIPHDAQGTAEVTKTGLLKTKDGLIVQPSSISFSKTGAIAGLTDAEIDAYKVDRSAAKEALAVNDKAAIKGKKTRSKKAECASTQFVPVVFIVKGVTFPSVNYLYMYVSSVTGTVTIGVPDGAFIPPVWDRMNIDDMETCSFRIGGLSGLYAYFGDTQVTKDDIKEIQIYKVKDAEDDGQEE